jgi:hypothetical protein
LGTGQLGDAEQADCSDEVDKALRDAHERADLADGLQLAPINGGYARERTIESNGHLGADDLLDATDERGIVIDHLGCSGRERFGQPCFELASWG